MKSNNFFRVALSVFVSFVFVFAVTYAATTISTNISTGGTLTVTGTANVTGLTTLVNATSTMLTVSGNTYLATTTLTGGSPLVLGTLSADPTGRSEGSVYYNSGSKVVKLYDGSNWFTVGTTTSGLTLSGQRLQLADLNYYTTFGTTTQSGLSVLTLEATSTAGIPLTLRGYNGQTADLFRIHSVDGTELFAIDALGNASTTQLTASGNLWVNGFATTTASNGNFATLGTLTAVGLSTLGNASTSQITTTGNLWVNGYATTTATNGNFATLGTLTAVGLTTLGNASTTNTSVGAGATGELWVGGNATTTAAGNISTKGSLTLANSSTAINGIVFGFCNIANSAAVTASTTAYFNCTGATGVTTNHRSFVQATSSLNADLFVQAASSTADGTINIQVANLGYLGASATIGDISLNFFGIR